MKRTNTILGMMLLLVAAAVAVYTTDGTEERALANRGFQESARPGFGPSSARERGRTPSKYRRPRGGYHPVIETLKVEPRNAGHPASAAQAHRVESGAHNRLQELTEGLDLSEQQQVAIFPLLARSHPDYDGQLLLVGVAAGLSPLPLSRREADRLLRGQLDSNQQVELEIMDLEAEAWWSDVIARLERDLEESTLVPLAVTTGSAPPDDDPSPPQDDQETPAAPAPRPGSHPGSNIKDILGGGSPR